METEIHNRISMQA